MKPRKPQEGEVWTVVGRSGKYLLSTYEAERKTGRQNYVLAKDMGLDGWLDVNDYDQEGRFQGITSEWNLAELVKDSSGALMWQSPPTAAKADVPAHECSPTNIRIFGGPPMICCKVCGRDM